MHTKTLQENTKERDQLEDLDENGRLLKCIFKKQVVRLNNWINTVEWWAPVNVIMNLRVPQMTASFLGYPSDH